MTKAQRLRDLAIKAYWAAETPKEAKMAGILLDLFAPDVAAAADGTNHYYIWTLQRSIRAVAA